MPLPTNELSKEPKPLISSIALIYMLIGMIAILLAWQISSNLQVLINWLSTNYLNGYEFRKYCLFFLSIITISLIARNVLQKKYPELHRNLDFIACTFCFLAILATCVLLSNSGQSYQTSLTVLISSIVLGTGWWIQSLVTSSSARKSHTINTIMNQRHSVHYFSKLDNVYKNFGFIKTINLEIADEYCNGNKGGRKIKAELIQGCRDAVYVMNYFEFISAGVIRKDFDEALIKECFLDPMKSFELRTYHLINVFRNEGEGNLSAFSNYTNLLDRWMPEKSLTTRKILNSNTPLPENVFANLNELYTPLLLGCNVNEQRKL